ncbi:MAG: post-PEP-CTERM-1 domain-containing protein [Geminicoccaceae bacterium]
MFRKSLLGFGITVGASVLALAGCDRSSWTGEEAAEKVTSSDASPARTACIDPESGALALPGSGVDCSVPAQAKPEEEPVVRDLEDGGKIIDLKGKFDKKESTPGSKGRMAVIDPETGKLIPHRPSDAKAAARYERSLARARARAGGGATSREAPVAETLPGGGFKVDLNGRFDVPLVATLSKDGETRIRHQH